MGILACHVDDMIWGGNEHFKINIINKLKETFKFGSEEVETFTYIGISLTQNLDIKEPNINSIIEITLTKDQMKNRDNT